jgi:cation transport ATPase
MPTVEETNEPVTTKKPRARKEVARELASHLRLKQAMSYKQAVITLVTGDLLCFLVFAALGSNTHGEVTGLASIPHIIVTALPFAAGWFLVSPFVGAFRRDIVARPRAMAIRTAVAWLISWPVTLILRGIFVDHGIPPLTFDIVVLLFNLLILEVWRWPFALNNSLRKRGV